MLSSVDLMTGWFFYQIISAGRTNGHGGPHAARGPRVGRASQGTVSMLAGPVSMLVQSVQQ